MKIVLSREEVLVCIIAIESQKRIGEWGKSALKKLLKSMGMGNKGEL